MTVGSCFRLGDNSRDSPRLSRCAPGFPREFLPSEGIRGQGGTPPIAFFRKGGTRLLASALHLLVSATSNTLHNWFPSGDFIFTPRTRYWAFVLSLLATAASRRSGNRRKTVARATLSSWFFYGA